MTEKKTSFWSELEDKISRHPIKIIVIVLALTSFFWYFMTTNTKINNDTESFFPEQNPVKVFFDKTNDIFGNSSGIIISLENPQGLYTLETLNKIKEITSKMEVLDNLISKKQLAKRLKVFTPEEVKKFLNLLNESLTEYSSAEDFLKALKNGEMLSEYFDEESSQAKVKNLSPQTIKGIYSDFTRFVDKKDRWNKRVRKVMSMSNVDYIFAQFTDTSKLDPLFTGLGLPLEKGKLLSEYLIEKSLITESALNSWLKEENTSSVLSSLGFSHQDITRLSQISNEKLTLWLDAIKTSPKQMKVSDLVDFEKIKTSPKQELFLLSERLRTWDMYQNMLYSAKNPNATLISIEMVPRIKKQEKEILIDTVYEEIAKIIKGTPILSHIAGEPVAAEIMGKNMVRDMGVLFPIVILVIILFLYLSFRHWRGVFLPLITVVLTTIWTLGTIALLDASISLVSTILPVLMVAVGSAYGIHIIHHYFEDCALGIPKEEALKKTITSVGLAVVMAGLTTIAGFGSLATNVVIPIKEFGIFAAIGIIYALLISLIFIPALLRTGKLPKKIAALKPASEEYFEEAHSKVGRLLDKIGHWTIHKHKFFFILLAAVLVFSIIGTSRLQVEANMMDQFKESTTIRQADSYIRDNFAGTSTLDLVIDTGEKNGILNYQFLQQVKAFQEEVKSQEMVGKATSVVDSIQKMHQSMNYGNPVYYRIPQLAFDSEGKEISFADAQQKQTAISKIILSYIDMFDSDDTRRMVDNQKQLLKINLILRTGSTIATAGVIDFVQEKSKKYFGAYLKNFDKQLGFAGHNPLTMEINNLLVKGQIWSILMSALIVILLVAFMQRSFLIGLISIIPLGLAILLNFAMMGFLGISLDVGTAIISNVAIGIGVDYTIHYMNGYLSLLKKGESKTQATLHTTVRSGQAILINAFSVAAGFIVLCFSSFLPIISTGWLIALTMLTTSFSALTFIPVILNKLKLKV